ncbi:bifunctional DNA-formamidopyrimidine glycosylase/DNA-(apurinic or apyrimidinic site) lyase [Candidatus Parcubacteria bacterium]|nr:bifunctional DNA-formamidopyrimidine glycosylase/DNA-(apurinic or apyrimidinic site) lyase [Candidatus Parcubacteria bacterium]
MPELPEVETTASQLHTVLPGLSIKDVWTDWEKMLRGESFAKFKKEIKGDKVKRVHRRAKNVLIELSGGKTILVHMKMTGHLLYGKFKMTKGKWVPDEKGPLNDPYNRFVHMVFTMSDGKHLVFSDMRKFGKFALLDTATKDTSPHLALLGPEPFDRSFTLAKFKERLLAKPTGRIKQVLMDQTVIAGIGNIYSDEMLFLAGLYPEERVANLTEKDFRALYAAMHRVLKHGIDFGGDSTSDYRNIHGERGAFQERHQVYRRTGKPCVMRGCKGVILRKKVGGRSAHYCAIHQPKKLKK